MEYNALKKKLMKHQIQMIERLKSFENHSILILNKNQQIKSRFGIFSNPAGSGKTFTIIAYLLDQLYNSNYLNSNSNNLDNNDTLNHTLNNLDNNKTKYTAIQIHHNAWITVEAQMIQVYSTLIICSQWVIPYWIPQLNSTFLKYIIYKKTKNPIMIENYNIILCPPTLLADLFYNYSTIYWYRIIYEEPLINKIKQFDCQFQFLWIITNNPYNLLKSPKYSFLSHLLQYITSYDLFKQIIICNTEQEIQESYQLMYLFKYRYAYVPSYQMNELFNQTNSIQLYHKNFLTIEEYIKYYNIKLFSYSQECIICFEKINFPINIISCCHHFYCLNCIIQWLKIRPTCPICRKIIYNNDINHINENKINNTRFCLTKDEIILQLLNKKDICLIVLSYSKYQHFFQKIKNHNYIIINHNFKLIEIEKYQLLILDIEKEFIGFNLQFVSNIIFYHKICPIKHDSIIQLVNRIGKINNLKIFYF